MNCNRVVSCLLLCIASAWPAAAAAQDAMPLGQSTLSEQELALWNSEAFKRQFTESYLAETEIEPRVNVKEREVMLKILERISANEMDRAAEMLEKSRTPAASAVFDFTLANIHFQREEFDKAASAYEAAVEKHPKFRRAWKNLALIYLRNQPPDFDRALPALTRVVELGGGDATTFGLLGFAYSAVDNHLAAESAYRMSMLLDPQTMDWKMGLARSLFKQERFADAAALCAQLLKADPDRTELWLLQANAYIGLNQPLRAAENYELIDRMGQSTVETLTLLGDIYVNEELYELAVDRYNRAMAKDPQGKPDRMVRAAKVLAARNALAECKALITQVEATFDERLQVNDRKDLLKLRARIAVAEGAGDEEARVLEEIVKLDPLDGEALILLGQYNGRNNNIEKAVFYYERAASISKFEADAKVRHAQLLVGQSRYADALPLLRSAQQIRPRENVQKYLEQIERIAKSR